MAEAAFRSGFVAVVGRPNVGKSTLLNRIVGEKIAITSEKPQTTRNRILGVLNLPESQIVFLDTPGIHRPKHRLGEYMVEVALNTLREVDLVLFVVDAAQGIQVEDTIVASHVRKIATPVYLVLNKIDLLAGDRQEVTAAFEQLYPFKAVFYVSALTGSGVDELIKGIVNILPPGPQYYPPDMITDQPERFMVAELVREQILHLTREEVPHSVAVEVTEMKERENGLVYINALIYVERESQKGIIVGEGGRMLKEIGKRARVHIENLLGTRTYLELWVKVKKDWRSKEGSLKSLGYDLRAD